MREKKKELSKDDQGIRKKWCIEREPEQMKTDKMNQ